MGLDTKSRTLPVGQISRGRAKPRLWQTCAFRDTVVKEAAPLAHYRLYCDIALTISPETAQILLIDGSSSAEPGTIVLWCGGQQAQEAAAHRFFRTEAATL